jgi:hypothetical protein
MPEHPTPVADDLVAALADFLQPLFDERPVVVWYDRQGVLEAPLRAAAERGGWRMAPGPGARNPLAGRAELEGQFLADGLQWLAERKWLVYVPAERRQPSWYEDLELAGRAVQKTLADVLAERHSMPPSDVAALLTPSAALRLVENWDRAFPSGTRHLELAMLGSALLALAFDEPSPLHADTAVLRFLREPGPAAKSLQRAGLTDTFIRVVRTQLGFGRLPEGGEIRPALLVRAMLASELVQKGACPGGAGLHNFLPQKNHIPAWASMAEAAVKDPECRPIFLDLARQVEQETRLVEHATSLNALPGVWSLPSADDRLLEEVAARCPAGAPPPAAVCVEIQRWAEGRLRLADLGLDVPEDWRVVASATRLLLGCENAERTLGDLSAPSPEDLVRRYADRQGGWWHLDDLHRGLELRFNRCRPAIVEQLGRPAVEALWRWSRRLADAFTDAFARAGRYAASGDAIPHHRFWAELVATGELGETAVLFADALRIDLAESLVHLLEGPGRQISTRLALASLPSKTPVGMASLLPSGGLPFAVLAKNGKLRAEIGDRDVSERDERIEQLRRALGEVEVGDLGRVSEAQFAAWARARRPVVLLTRDIDDSGEIAAKVAPDLFEDLVADLARTVTVLHRVGYRRVVVGTDHGFLLVPGDVNLEEVPAPSKSSTTTFSTRYAVGELQPDTDCLALTPQQMGRAGTARTLLPRGLRAFPVSGPRHRFVHGGLSPQECVLRFITSTLKGPPRAPVQVRLVRLRDITSHILYLSVEVTTPAGPAQPRRVRAEAHSGGREVGRSEAFTYQPDTELSPGEVYPRIKLALKEPGESVDLALLDEDSGEVLDTQPAVPNVMRREAEEDLL